MALPRHGERVRVRSGHDAAADIAVTVRHDMAAVDEAEFRRFYEQTARPLRAWLRRVAGVEHVDDLAQETYLRFLRAAVHGLPEDERRAYLYRIATNLVRDGWRAERRRGTTVDDHEVEAPETSPADAIDVQRAMSRLRLRERTLVWLAYVERASHREIAAALDVKEGSVRVLLSRARQKLAGALKAGRGGRP